ncbi:unnamed protein product [Darwinula stevensoni]|uniref:Uncharacterized protein n=1 Tax=Darwinula stevensoni TaxID=69355 RepID=A0A7R9FUM1_9CRUS|nr:unnamed protein product [Darwinula stevensoni]CAG0910044.1 unnamed protein product [Darwinula stevensoni]
MRVEVVEGPRGQPVHGHPLPLAHRRGQLPLALRLSLRVPGGGGEDRAEPEGVALRPGSHAGEGPAPARPPGLGRRPLLGRRLPRL